MVVDRAAFPIARAMLRHLHRIEPERAYRSIIFTDAEVVDGDVEVRDLSDLMGPIADALGEVAFLRSSLTITEECYGRLALGQALGSEFRTCLYLDYDVLIRGALSPLFRTALDGHDFAAVPSLNAIYHTHDPKRLAGFHRLMTELGLEAADDYFNSGVMLIDLQRFDFAALAEAVRQIDRAGEFAHRRRVGDQDLLNRLYQGRFRPLSPRWNLTTPFQVREVERALNPRIIHFTGPDKPWHRSWLGPRHLRREVMEILAREGVVPARDRPRKALLSDRYKKIIRSTEPGRSLFSLAELRRRRRHAADFLAHVGRRWPEDSSA